MIREKVYNGWKKIRWVVFTRVLSEWKVYEKKGWNVVEQEGGGMAEVKKSCNSMRLDFFCIYQQLKMDKELKKAAV